MSRSEFLDEELLQLLRTSIDEGSTVPTVSQNQPNRVVSIEPGGVLIETDRSRQQGQAPQLVPAWMLNVAWRHLQNHRRLTQTELVATDQLNVKRSAAVLALLAQLPGVEVVSRRPSELGLKRDSSWRRGTSVPPREATVLIRGETTTTYHFGHADPICGDARGHSPAVPSPLTAALAARRRLCRNCAVLLAEWTEAMLYVVSATGIEHPEK